MALNMGEPIDKSYHWRRRLIVNDTGLVDCQLRIILTA